MENVQWILEFIAAPIIGFVVLWLWRLQARIAMTERDLSKFMVEAAKTYVTKEDLEKTEHMISERFDRLEKKIDALLTHK